MPPRLGILAGGGELPARVAAACRARGRDVFIVAIEGETDGGTIEAYPHAWSELGTLARTLSLMKEAGCEEVMLVGPVRNAWSRPLKPDARAAALLARLTQEGLGDDAVFSMVVNELEAEGFHVVGVDDVLVDLLAPEGVVGKLGPDEDDDRDIQLGVRVLTALGELDVGQAAVVQSGVILGIEGQEGTDELIRRCGALGRAVRGAVLIKLMKSGQERRVDLPTIGVATVEGARAAGFRGIAVEAGHTLIVDRDKVAAASDAAGLYVVGIVPDRG